MGSIYPDKAKGGKYVFAFTNPLTGKRERHYMGVFTQEEADALKSAFEERYESVRNIQTAALHAVYDPALRGYKGKGVVTVGDLIERYRAYCRDYYVDRDGQPTSQMDLVNRALKGVEPFKDLLIELWDNEVFLAIRKTWVETPMTRTVLVGKGRQKKRWIDARGKRSRVTVNKYMTILKQMFRWGNSRQIIPPGLSAALNDVENLKIGRTKARETGRRPCAPIDAVKAVRADAPEVIRILIDTLLLTGARPDEVLKLKPCNIDRFSQQKDGVWVTDFRRQGLDQKNAFRDQDRLLVFGPAAQDVLQPLLDRRLPDQYLFDPREAYAEQRRAAAVESKTRRDNQSDDARETDRVIGERYTPHSFCRFITRKCEKLGVERWTPYQLRHNYLQTVYDTCGREVAKESAGHKSVKTLDVYVNTLNKSIKAAKAIVLPDMRIAQE